MSLFRNENPILGSLTQITWADGTLHYLAGNSDPALAGDVIFPPIGAVKSTPVLSFAGSVSMQPFGGHTGFVTAGQFDLTVGSTTTVTNGYLYGLEASLIVLGTVSSANFLSGIAGKLNLVSATLTSPGPMQAIWGDMGPTMSASAIAGEADLNVMLLTCTCPGAMINSAIKIETLSTYILDFSNVTYSSFYTSTVTVGAQTGRIKVNTPAGVAYIPCYLAS